MLISDFQIPNWSLSRRNKSCQFAIIQWSTHQTAEFVSDDGIILATKMIDVLFCKKKKRKRKRRLATFT